MSIELPEKCLRNNKLCQPLAQLKTIDENAFICCGYNDIRERSVPQNRFCYCFKNKEFDEMSHWDERDIKDTIHVLARALSVDANWIPFEKKN